MITAEVKILGKIYSAQGSSVSDALSKIKGVRATKALSILTVTNGDKQKSRVLIPRQTFRLFSDSPLTKEVAIKQISLLF